MKAPSPLLGFNNNVRHRGRVFHIQTEDSGVRHPHIITHLFADGGRILKTVKTSYVDQLEKPTMVEFVRALMQDQHKGMILALREGQYDSLFEDAMPMSTRSAMAFPAQPAPGPAAVPAPAAAAPIVAPPVAEPIAPAPALPVLAYAAPIAAATPPASVAVVALPVVAVHGPISVSSIPEPPPSPHQELPGGPMSRRRPNARPRLDLEPGAIHTRDSAPPAHAVTVANESVAGILDLDLDALEHAAAEAQTPFFQQIRNLPPPPAAVLAKTPATTPGSYTPAPPAGQRMSQTALPAPSVVARYAPSRPAAIFASSRPLEGASIFGEDLISEKSLDEVILGYLAEDLEGPEKK